MAKGIKTGGRKEGTPNRDRRNLLERLYELYPNYHPVLAMAQMANDESLDKQLRFQANKEVAKYVCPQLKAVQLSAENSESPPVVIKVVREDIKELIEKT